MQLLREGGESSKDASFHPLVSTMTKLNAFALDIPAKEQNLVNEDALVVDCSRVRADLGGSKCAVVLTRQPLLSADECAWLIREAEQVGSSNAGKGWSTDRHYQVMNVWNE